MVVRICEVCSNKFNTFPCNIKVGRGKFCSKKCFYKYRENITGEKHPLYKKKIRTKCKNCGKIFFIHKSYTKKVFCCSRKCSYEYAKINPNRRGENCSQWTDDPKYDAIHSWLRKTFGKADRCENQSCKNISKKYHWAKKKGYAYERNRRNFFRLCSSCHNLYDEMSVNRERDSKGRYI